MNSSSMATPPNSNSKEAKAYLERAKACSSQVIAARARQQPTKSSQHPVINAVHTNSAGHSSTPSRGAALITASQRSSSKNLKNGFWEQGKPLQKSPSPVIDIDSDENLSLNYEPHSKTYSKRVTPKGGAMNNFDKLATESVLGYSKNPIAQLTSNPSVTVTALSSGSPVTVQKNFKNIVSNNSPSFLNKSLKSSPLSGNMSKNLNLPCSSRKLNFDSSNEIKKSNEENMVDSDKDVFPRAPLRVKKLARTPLKPVRKSSLLNGISPSKIERAYGGPSSNPEKENVPIVKEEEEEEALLQPHLLGFPNLGNTCYLNAVLQSLVSMRVFRLDVRSFVQRLPPPADSLLHGLASLLDARKTGRPSSLRRPLRLVKENFEKLDSSFIGWKMQDANEFLTKILDTIKDEVDKLLEEEIHKSKTQKPTLPFSPIQSNAPRLFNNSVVIRSLSPGEAAAAYKSLDHRRGLKRCLSSESLEQNGSSNAGNDSDSNNSSSLRLVVSDSEDNQSDCDSSPPRAKFSKTPSKSSRKTNTDFKNSNGSGASHFVNSRSKTSGNSNNYKQSSEQQLTPLKKSPQSNHKTCSNDRTLNGSLENEVSSNPITANFGFHLQEVYTCLGCSARVRRSQEYFSLYVHLASCELQDSNSPSSMRAAVAEYMKQEQRDLKCERCSHSTALVTTTFTKMPRILVIQVKRYTFDASEFSSLKVCSSIEVNKTLDLSAYTGTSVRRYPSLTTGMISAPSTPVKGPPPPALRVFGGARAEVLQSNGDGPSSAQVLDGGFASVADSVATDPSIEDSNKIKPLSEDEQIQEALRRSLEDTVVPICGGAADSAPAASVISVDEEEEDDLMKAIRLSLQEAQERERAKAEEEKVLAQVKAIEAKTDDIERFEEPDDECEGSHSYRLASIVSHYGRNTTAGHYVCDALSEKSDVWLHYDDECVTEVPVSEVLGPSRQRNGYIFFYVHKDLLNLPSQVQSS